MSQWHLLRYLWMVALPFYALAQGQEHRPNFVGRSVSEDIVYVRQAFGAAQR